MHRTTENRPTSRNFRQGRVLECGDMSPLSDWQTCLSVPKRGHDRALRINTRLQPGVAGRALQKLFQQFSSHLLETSQIPRSNFRVQTPLDLPDRKHIEGEKRVQKP